MFIEVKMHAHLQKSSVQKIFREHFTGDVPIVKYGFEKEMLISELKQAFSTLTGFALSDNYYYLYIGTKSEEICNFKIAADSEQYANPEFSVTFNAQNQLILEKWYTQSTPVYHLEQIYTLYDKMKSEFKRLEANYRKRQPTRESDKIKRENHKLKKEKIKGLKHKAIIAKIHQIAKEDQLAFYVRKYQTKVKLVVRLAESEKMEIDIPHSQFQDILQNLRVMVQTMKEFHALGIKVKMRRTCYREPKWISYKESTAD